MPRPDLRRLLIPLLLAVATPLSSRAADVLDSLPENVLGLVVVRNLEGANSKAELLLEKFQYALPAPWEFVKMVTGLDEGIDPQGDLLVALVPGSRPNAEPQPLVLLPIVDYEVFANSIRADTSGEICRVELAGEALLVARKGTLAILMNVEHRATLERLLGSQPDPVRRLGPLSIWLAQTDLAIVIMPAGIKALGRAERQPIQHRPISLFKQMVQQLRMGLVFFQNAILNDFNRSLDVAAVGVAIDKRSNVRLGYRAVLIHGSDQASADQPAEVQSSPLVGHAAGPYVLAVSGRLATDADHFLGALWNRMNETLRTMGGDKPLSLEDQQKQQQAQELLRDGARQISLVFRPGQEDDPLLAGVSGVVHVDDAEAYLQSVQKSFVLENEVLANTSTDLLLQWELTPTTVADGKGYEIAVDIGVANDPNVPDFIRLIESVVGENGKFDMQLVAADPTTVLLGIESEQEFPALLENVRQGEQGLQQQENLQATLKLLDNRATWLAVISPRGLSQWVRRGLGAWFRFGGAPLLPEITETPPIGFSLNLENDLLEADLVWPIETIDALVDYFKELQEL